MPKSKRAKVVHLTKTDKKGKELTEKIFNAVQEAADEYSSIIVFRVENMRNNFLKEIRTELSDSKIIYGRTKVMAKALGIDPSSEHLPGLSSLTPHLKGDIGLLFTSRDPSEITIFLDAFSQTDYARAGAVATQTLTVPGGVVHSRAGEIPASEDVPLPHSVEPTLRKWGMPTRLDRGKVTLDGEYTVCKEGEVLNSHQTALLKMFGVAMAEFKVKPVAWWGKATGEVSIIDEVAVDKE